MQHHDHTLLPYTGCCWWQVRMCECVWDLTGGWTARCPAEAHGWDGRPLQPDPQPGGARRGRASHGRHVSLAPAPLLPILVLNPSRLSPVPTPTWSAAWCAPRTRASWETCESRTSPPARSSSQSLSVSPQSPLQPGDMASSPSRSSSQSLWPRPSPNSLLLSLVLVPQAGSRDSGAGVWGWGWGVFFYPVWASGDPTALHF